MTANKFQYLILIFHFSDRQYLLYIIKYFSQHAHTTVIDIQSKIQ